MTPVPVLFAALGTSELLSLLADTTFFGKFILLVLLVCSLVTMAVAIERALYFRRRSGNPEPVLLRALDQLRKGDLSGALTQLQTTAHPMGRVAEEVLTGTGGVVDHAAAGGAWCHKLEDAVVGADELDVGHPAQDPDVVTSQGTPRLEMRGVTKRYPGVVACDSIDLDVRQGEIHARADELARDVVDVEVADAAAGQLGINTTSFLTIVGAAGLAVGPRTEACLPTGCQDGFPRQHAGLIPFYGQRRGRTLLSMAAIRRCRWRKRPCILRMPWDAYEDAVGTSAANLVETLLKFQPVQRIDRQIDKD